MATVGKNNTSWYLSYINKGTENNSQYVDLIVLYNN